MYNVAIVGAGQLGSRHLQGVKCASSSIFITVVDSSEESLKVAKERYDLISAIGEKKISFTSDISSLPPEIDLVIVATGSIPRANIVKSLLKNHKVRYIVLEKVLFPRLSDYDEVGQLLEQNGVYCWVNCPRRMYGIYSSLYHRINREQPVYMKNLGENWGLCCNSIHNIDIFMYLSGQSTYTIDVSGLHRKIDNSKRAGYIEMTGTVAIKTPNGSTLILTSENDYEGPVGKFIENDGQCFFLDEAKAEGRVGDNSFRFTVPFQSQLSGLLVDEILMTGGCQLTPFDVSASYHKPFLSALLAFYNEVREDHSDILPIT